MCAIYCWKNRTYSQCLRQLQYAGTFTVRYALAFYRWIKDITFAHYYYAPHGYVVLRLRTALQNWRSGSQHCLRVHGQLV